MPKHFQGIEQENTVDSESLQGIFFKSGLFVL